MPKYRLGKLPARKGAVKFKLSRYLDLSQLPVPPDEFGHTDLITDWGVMANDEVGDCVLAGAAHETMLWNIEAGQTIPFSNEAVLSDYSAITGYDPSNPDSDQGTDMQVAAEYRRTTGIVDTNGNRHKVVAYLAIEPGNLNQLLVAMYLFEGVGIGIRFPGSAMKQFENGQPWTPPAPDDPDGQIEGGHYIPGFAKRGGNILCVTWGKVQPMSPEFFTQFCDEAVVYLTSEDLKDGKTLEGFSLDDLQADLAKLKSK